MVEHELRIGTAGDQQRAGRQLPGEDAEVEGQTGGADTLDVVDEGRRAAQFVWRSVEDAADAFHAGDGGDALEVGGEVRRLGATGCDRTDDAGMDGQHEAGLGFHIGVGDVDFHVESRLDAEVTSLREVILGGPLLVEGRGGAEPGIGEAVLVDQVQVGIDDAHLGLLVRHEATRCWSETCRPVARSMSSTRSRSGASRESRRCV